MTMLTRTFWLLTATAVAILLAASVLVTVSYFIAAHRPQGFLVMHLVVSGVFLLLGLLVAGIGVQVAGLARIASGDEGLRPGDLRARVFRLLVLLVIAGLGLCTLLAFAMIGILGRIGQGFAMFG